MKKTMITLAAVFAAMVTMAAVTSQVVGYNTSTLVAGFNCMTPMFVGMGTAANLTFGTIKVPDGASYDQFQVFDSTGEVIQTVYYWADDQSWYDFATDAPMNDVEIPVGTAYFFSSQNGGSMVVSGQVLTDSVQVSLANGFTPFGNPYPVAVTFGSLSNTGLVSYDQFQLFDTTGEVIQTVYYWADDQSWYDFATDAPMNDEIIPAGQGFFFSAQNADCSITFPALVL